MGPEDQPSVGLFHSGIQHLSIGTATFEEYSDEKWEYELRMTIAHELIHFLQDIEGSIGKGNYEDQAESKAEEFVKSMGYVDPDAWTKENLTSKQIQLDHFHAKNRWERCSVRLTTLG